MWNLFPAVRNKRKQIMYNEIKKEKKIPIY